MKRPFGVAVIAIALVALSSVTLYRALTPPGLRMGRRFLEASVIIAILGLLAAVALWRLSPYAFLLFTLWAICAMAGLVLTRLSSASSGHGLRVFGPIVYAGLLYALAALYLRRVS